LRRGLPRILIGYREIHDDDGRRGFCAIVLVRVTILNVLNALEGWGCA
jgi:hypothetical protein